MNTRLRLRHRCPLLLLVASVLLLCTALPASSTARPRPLVEIVKAPRAHTAATNAVFRLKRARAATTLCRVDRRRYRPCRTRVKYTRMRPGKHIFRVRARRNGRKTAVRRRWTVLRPGQLPPASDEQLVFAEEFNGTAVNPGRWRLYNGPGYVGHGLRRPSAFSLDGNNLVTTAKMVDGKIVSGGMAHRHEFRYGRVEFRVRTDVDPSGTMSGIVMTWPKHQRSPEFTENDIYETGYSRSRTPFRTFIHYGTTSQEYFEHQVDASQWHTMAMEWRSNSLKIYRDGQLVWSTNRRDVIPDQLHHVAIQLDARATRTLTRPVRMLVDYVRVYR